MNISITVKNKIATGDGTLIVCRNSDYIVNFTFDEEWAEYGTKTMRVQEQGNKYVDVIFTGTSANLPVLVGQSVVHIGVYAGNLHTTTPAYFRCKPSILCEGGNVAEPSDDIYNQLMQRMAQLEAPTKAPFYIDASSSDYSTTDTAYGDKIAAALNTGAPVYYIGTANTTDGIVQKITLVTWADVETTSGGAKLTVGVGARDGNAGVTFAITKK